MFNNLLNAGPEGVSKVDLSMALFGQHGTSEKKMGQTAQLVTSVRRKLDRYGYHIQRNPPLKHGVYRLIPAEAGA
ncbi:hypothetical protein U8C35_07690 [Sinorhizobium medicae]|uniref:hypothetical protein n=1 Tax=Sinorhizobium medicae TaxID=110321 RepID=UPI002AF6C7C7|nr:hypothetical protein [Sinorhizobium medicae]WQO60293.1 hypothetical protein U8C35_07690 [Sinorhizobium medicae]